MTTHTKKRNAHFPLFDSYVKGETLLGGWGFIGTGLALLSTFLLVSRLEVFDYGIYLLVIAFFSLVSGFSIDLLQGVVLNDVARFIGTGDQARAKRLFLENAFVQLILALLLSVAVFLGAKLVASWYDKDIALLFRIASPLFLINAVYTKMRMLFKAHFRFDLIATRLILSKVLRVGFLVSFIVFGSLNIRSALIAYVGASLLAVLTYIPAFLRIYAPWRNIEVFPKPILWSITKAHGKWSILGDTFKGSVLDFKPWLIKIFIGAEAVAIYSFAESAYGVLKGFLPTETLNVVFPRVTSDTERTKMVLLLTIKYLVLVAILLSAAGAVVAPLLIYFLFPQYSQSLSLFYILLPALPLLAFRAPTAAFVFAHRRQRFLFTRHLVVSITSLVFPLIFLPLFGVTGMALERIISSIIITVLLFWHLTKHDIPLTAWREVVRLDRGDLAVLLRLWHFFRSRLRQKIPKWMLSPTAKSQVFD